ncbi:MAG: hypothetical protein HFF23_09720 [Oscillospiraceae bacterium]|nr:hypothetical protein [Oscillospiraceae bacterium]
MVENIVEIVSSVCPTGYVWGKNFLTRTRQESDRRVVILSLTPKGRAAAERIQAKLNHYLELLGALPNDAKAELVRGYLAANQMLDYLFEQTKGE